MAEITNKNRHKSHRMHPNSLANLTPWKKGCPPPNPKGRPPKDCSLTSLLKEKIFDKVPGDKEGRTWRQLLVERWLTKALTDAPFFKELMERLEGKTVQAIQIEWKQEAARIAEELGLDAAEVLKEAEQIFKEKR